jgi:hypothetical protein
VRVDNEVRVKKVVEKGEPTSMTCNEKQMKMRTGAEKRPKPGKPAEV